MAESLDRRQTDGRPLKPGAPKRGRADDWTSERIGQLSTDDIKQLRANAERLSELGVVALCSDVLKAKARPRTQSELRDNLGPRTTAGKLIARTKAFSARGVQLQDVRTSWGGVRKSDGAIVMALWAEAIVSADGACHYLLWAPNAAGARPWSDTPAGKERLEHCKRAIALGRAEGLLVYGRRLEGSLPEEKAAAIHGVDSDVVVSFEVEVREQEYWAVWGRKPAEAVAA